MRFLAVFVLSSCLVALLLRVEPLPIEESRELWREALDDAWEMFLTPQS